MRLQLGICSARLLAPWGRSCTLISDRLLSIWQTPGSLHSWWQQRQSAKLKSDTGPVQSCMEEQVQAIRLHQPIRAFIFPILPQIRAFSSHQSHWPLLASSSPSLSRKADTSIGMSAGICPNETGVKSLPSASLLSSHQLSSVSNMLDMFLFQLKKKSNLFSNYKRI